MIQDGAGCRQCRRIDGAGSYRCNSWASPEHGWGATAGPADAGYLGRLRAVRVGFAPERGRLRRAERIDDLGTLGADHARRAHEPYADLIALAPHDLAIGLHAVELDDQLERVGKPDHVVDAQTCPRR